MVFEQRCRVYDIDPNGQKACRPLLDRTRLPGCQDLPGDGRLSGPRLGGVATSHVHGHVGHAVHDTRADAPLARNRTVEFPRSG